MLKYLTSPIERFRLIAFGEGLSFLLILFVTMPLKYWLEIPDPNKVVGMVHGLLFVLYVIAVIQINIEFKWKSSKTALALLASVVPFGTFYFNAKYLDKNAEEEISGQS